MIDKLQESVRALSLKSYRKGDYSDYAKNISERTKNDKAFLHNVLRLSNYDQKNLVTRVKKKTV